MDRLPLQDITILDLSWVLAGPHASRLFKEMGARVIKVETSRSIDVLRTGAMRKGNDNFKIEAGWSYNDQNRNKESIGINLKSEKGREALYELVKISDIVMCNYGINAFRKLGLTYDDLSKHKKDIIVLNASGMGDWGPQSQYVTFAPVLMSIAGVSGLIGYEGSDVPYDDYPPFADYLGAMAVANHLMAALEYRRKTGEGQFIDLSQCEAATSYMGTVLLDYQVNGTKRDFIGNRHYADSAVPHGAYKCKGDSQKWCAISVVSEEEWCNFCNAVDPQNEWSADEKFATLENRIKNREELDNLVTQWTVQRSPQEVGDYLQYHGVSAAPVQQGLDILYKDMHLKDREFFQEIDFEDSDRFPPRYIVTGPVVKIKGYNDAPLQKPAVSLGGNTRDILVNTLGKTEEWVEEALAEGAFEIY